MFRHVFHSRSGLSIALAAGAVHSYTARPGEHVICHSGRIWLTQFDVTEDFDLRAGMEIEVRTHGLIVLEAVEASVILRQPCSLKYRETRLACPKSGAAAWTTNVPRSA